MKEARKPLLRKGKNGKVESSIDALDAYQVVSPPRAARASPRLSASKPAQTPRAPASTPGMRRLYSAKAHRSELVFVSSPLRDNPYLRDACSPARGKSPRKSPRPAKA